MRAKVGPPLPSVSQQSTDASGAGACRHAGAEHSTVLGDVMSGLSDQGQGMPPLPSADALAPARAGMRAPSTAWCWAT